MIIFLEKFENSISTLDEERFNASSNVGSHVTQKKIPPILESIQFANIFELNVEARMSQFWYEISSQLSTPFKSAEFTSRTTFTKIDIAYL